MMTASSSEPRVRRAAVAGSFYPLDAAALREELRRLLVAVPSLAAGALRPKALIVPHAGYPYSGPVAASAYAQLRASGPPVERVVLVGPSHLAAHAGLALPDVEFFMTPLGAVKVDESAAALAAALPQVTVSGAAHQREHALEVQLPFLQVVLGEFSLVPLTVGHASPEDVAEVLHALWGGPETLVICSTDLSHYLPYGEACALDRRTAAQVKALDAHAIRREQACGSTPLAGLLLEAARRGLTPSLLDLRNSGDTTSDQERVVGYGAFALHEPPRPRAAVRGPGEPAAAPGPQGVRGPQGAHQHRAEVATGLARAAVANLFGGPPPLAPAGEPWLEERRACFVSLYQGGDLRGCIGALEPRGPLFQELVSCARAAATRDPRFESVRPEELPALTFEVSVLSPVEPLPARDEAEALARLRPGLDGLVLQAGGRTATFIPAVWEQLPDPRDFLSHLRRKAGLPDLWQPGTRLSRFTANLYREPEPG
jgi:AmmeMemoRadiSam system protein B/AmmeMemoRadiSam system protein A